MGTQLTTPDAQSNEVGRDTLIERDIPVVPWLDPQTAGLVRAMIIALVNRHPDLRAVILYGSVARHDERPLDDTEPSDVDVLLIFDRHEDMDYLPHEQRIAIFRSIGLARDEYLDAPREVQVMLAMGDLVDWDPTFVANVARDGILLWARGPLPESLTAITDRSTDSAVS